MKVSGTFVSGRHSMLIFGLTAKKLISHDIEKSSVNLRENFEDFIKGLISVPLAIPGTAYHKCLQGRKKVTKMLKNMLDERLANIAPGIFRKAITDVKYKDYTIPSGWIVMVCPPGVHLNPVNYKDPVDFNPWRWEGMDLKIASKTFMAFGGGQRFCVGADFARLQMAVFLHCLVTKYRWKVIKGGEIKRTPGLQFPNGFHVQFFEKDKQNQDPTFESAG